jgi:hypothetical protein
MVLSSTTSPTLFAVISPVEGSSVGVGGIGVAVGGTGLSVGGTGEGVTGSTVAAGAQPLIKAIINTKTTNANPIDFFIRPLLLI